MPLYIYGTGNYKTFILNPFTFVCYQTLDKPNSQTAYMVLGTDNILHFLKKPQVNMKGSYQNLRSYMGWSSLLIINTTLESSRYLSIPCYLHSTCISTCILDVHYCGVSHILGWYLYMYVAKWFLSFQT